MGTQAWKIYLKFIIVLYNKTYGVFINFKFIGDWMTLLAIGNTYISSNLCFMHNLLSMLTRDLYFN